MLEIAKVKIIQQRIFFAVGILLLRFDQACGFRVTPFPDHFVQVVVIPGIGGAGGKQQRAKNRNKQTLKEWLHKFCSSTPLILAFSHKGRRIMKQSILEAGTAFFDYLLNFFLAYPGFFAG
jgi:hypothetical protein